MDKPTIIRRCKNRYTAIPHALARDSSLSLDALGLIVRILTHPPDWDIRLAQLRSESGIGRDKCRKLLKNIMAAGYMRRAKTRDDAGQWMYIYTVYDEPQTPEPEIITAKKTTQKESIDGYLTLGAKYGGAGGGRVRDPGGWMAGVAARIAQQGGLSDADRAQLARWRRRAAEDEKARKNKRMRELKSGRGRRK